MLKKCAFILLVLLFNATVYAGGDAVSIVSVSKEIFKGEIDFFDNEVYACGQVQKIKSALGLRTNCK